MRPAASAEVRLDEGNAARSRFTDGMYYEIRDALGFEKAFGDSFERYVGEVFEKANRSESLTICAAQPYHVGKDRKDSVDWVVSDPTGDLFIECKTKRLRANAKSSLASTEILDDDLDKMAGFIVQTYKTLIDALDGRYEHWTARADKPIYPLIVTLEEWFAVGNKILPEIDKVAHRKLAESQIDAALMEKYPYTICAIQDLELVAQIIPITGIHTMMRTLPLHLPTRLPSPQHLVYGGPVKFRVKSHNCLL